MSRLPTPRKHRISAHCRSAEAAELAEAMSGPTDGSGGPLTVRDPLRPLACAIARALTEARFTALRPAPWRHREVALL